MRHGQNFNWSWLIMIDRRRRRMIIDIIRFHWEFLHSQFWGGSKPIIKNICRISKPINKKNYKIHHLPFFALINFREMNIHLPAILGFTRCQDQCKKIRTVSKGKHCLNILHIPMTNDEIAETWVLGGSTIHIYIYTYTHIHICIILYI